MTDFLIGRQQIFDRNLTLFGYELLFRPAGDHDALVADGSGVTQQLVVDAILELGLEKLTGGALAFINFTSANLLSEIAEALPKDKAIRRDPVLSLKLLNFINSAFFALARRITSIEHAVILLGNNSSAGLP